MRLDGKSGDKAVLADWLATRMPKAASIAPAVMRRA